MRAWPKERRASAAGAEGTAGPVAAGRKSLASRDGWSTWARLGLLIGVALIRLPSISEPRWYSDDGFFTSVAWATSHGLPLYRGVYDNSPPGIYWLYRGLLALGAGRTHMVVQLAAAGAVLASSLLTFELGRRLFSPRIGLLAGSLTGLALSLPTLDGDLMNVELAALPFLLGALVAAWRPTLKAAALAGALAAAGIAVRPSFSFDALALVVPLLAVSRGRWGRLAAAAGGAVVVWALALLALWMSGSLLAYRTVVLPSDHAYLVWANGGRLTALYMRLGLLAAASGLGLLIARSPRSRLLCIWIPASLAGASLTPRQFPHYSHEAIPALAFGLAVLAARLACGRARLRLLAPLAALCLLGAAEGSLILPALETAAVDHSPAPGPVLDSFSLRQLPDYYGNWLAYATGREGRRAYTRLFPGASGPSQADAAFLRHFSRLPEPPRLLVLGDRPWLYFESGLLPATPYIGLNSSFRRLPSGRARVRTDLLRGCAGLVVVADDGRAWSADLTPQRYRLVLAGPWPIYRSRQGGAGRCPAG